MINSKENPKKQKIPILGINFPSYSGAEAKKHIANRLAQSGTEASLVFTPNTDILLKCTASESLISLINSADLLLPDGSGIVLASKLLGTPLSERISGIDTGEFILSVAEKAGLSVYLLGSRENTAKAAAEKIKGRYKQINICGFHHGFFEKKGKENESVIERIKAAQPDIIFVCFGFPAQEIWLSENASKVPSLRLGIGLGGSLDVWSGDKKRAPVFFQKTCLEWLWRGLCEPRRLKIMLKFPEFFFRILAQKRKAGAISKAKI